MSGHTDSVTCMVIEGYLLFTGSDDKTILHWDLKRFTKIGMIGRHEERKYLLFNVKNVLYCSNPRPIASG